MNLSEKDLFKGDHVYVRRGLHSHHGIYVGEGRVIHFKGALKEKSRPAVTETGLEEFLQGGKLRRRDHEPRLPREKTVRRARGLLEGRDYSMVRNNCEHLATFCVAGKARSHQVRTAAAGLGAVVTSAITLAWIRRKNRD